MGSRLDNTIVVIPSYNEARTIGSVVNNIVQMGMSVLVVDDGSVDATERIALDNGAMVIRHKRNLGKGHSVRQAIRYVTEKTNFEWVIMMDGDGQHHTEDLMGIMEATRIGGVEFVTGNRMQSTKTMPALRYWTNRFMSFVISKMCHQNIPDTQCGYRLLSVNALKRIKLESGKYDIESEMLIQAAREGMKISSVPVQTIYGDEISAINPFLDTIRFFSLVLKNQFRSSPRGKRNGTDIS
jgi:glycosyltransferase involved in cell wall biosynthesis